jgi:predicted N-acetyltransferase YhbS
MNPIHEGVISVCTDEDNIVGVFHLIPLRIKLGDTTHLSGNGTDLAVHPGYLGKGIYRKLRNTRNAELDKIGIKYP